MNNKNPFSNPDGTPLEGKLEEFVEWEEEQRKIREEEMPAQEKRKYDNAQERLSKKMNS